jgi:hypothetical protein
MEAREMELAKGIEKVFLCGMSAAVCEQPASDPLSGIQAQGHELTIRQILQWFDWMDRILSVHRAQFLLREAAATQLESHKVALREAIRYCLVNQHPDRRF